MSNEKKKNSISTAALMLVLGILMLLAPKSLMASFIRVAGLLVLLYGIYEIITFVKSQFKNYGALIWGAVTVMIGIYALAKPNSILDAVPLILGICLLIIGIQKFFVLPVSAIPDIVFGAILLICGFGVFDFALRVIGIILILDAAADLAAALKK